jgi:hypothetical protein
MWQDFLFYFAEGWHHIIHPGALDHILFIAALAVVHAPADWKRLVILVTAFTAGHALTLVLSVTDIVRFPEDWVEFLIPCTIVATAAANLLRSRQAAEREGLRYAMALVFGLVHGMGYANAVRFTLAGDQSLALGLVAFNAGLEIGQILVVLSILLLGFLFIRLSGRSRQEWVAALSSIVLAASLYMVWDRHPF